MLAQIQVFDSLIAPTVESLRFLSGLSYDVLCFCIVESLSAPDKERTKHDGTTVSMWIQNLAVFIGTVSRKYNLDITGLLQYIANQLLDKKR